MTSLLELFDSYSRKAKLYPGLLVILPVLPLGLLQLPGIAASGNKPGWLPFLWSILAVAGVPFLLTNMVRSRGKAAQKRLLTDWDRFPTTHALRHRGTDSPQRRAHRRQRLEQLLSVQLPTKAQEDAHPTEADGHYEVAIDRLITRIRAHADVGLLVQDENAQYGFRRNLLGVKPAALAVLGSCLIIDLLLVVGILPVQVPNRAASTAVVAGHAMALLGWLVQVRPAWVREAADDYTARLFAALDDPRL